MAELEKKLVSKTKVVCDGGTLGHPRVYLNMGEKKHVDCPYCGKQFLLKKEEKLA